MKSSVKKLLAAPALLKIWEILPDARLVGGCVRDLVAGCSFSDLDLAVGLPPEEIQERLEKGGVRVVATGIAHGTVTAFVKGDAGETGLEITALRQDVETDGRHAVVQWCEDWETDAARRDFTINALSMDRKGKLYDYFSGLEDLKAGRVQFVGDADSRIKEDYLRILRFFRFQARYGKGVPSPDLLAALKNRAPLLRKLSRERLTAEILRLVSGPNLAGVLPMMEETGVFAALFSSFDVPALLKLEQKSPEASPLARLSALLPEAENEKHLALSQKQKKYLRICRRPIEFEEKSVPEKTALGLLADSARETALDRLALAKACWGAGKTFTPCWERLRTLLLNLPEPVFPLNGRDLENLGVSPGPEMGRRLEAAREFWKKSGCSVSREALLSWLERRLKI